MLENIIDKESRGFLNGFVSRVGRAFFPLVLSSGLLLNSCTSTSQYHDYREEPETRTKEEKVLDEKVINKGVRYKIQQEGISFDNINVVKIPVIEERYEEKRIEKRVIERMRFDEYKFVTTEKSSAGVALGTGIIIGLGVGLLGALIGSLIKKEGGFRGYEDEEKESHAGQGFYIGFGVGFFTGLVAGSVVDDAKFRRTDEYRTGSSEIRTIVDKVFTEDKDYIIFSGPAKSLKLGLTSEHIGFKNDFVSTNSEGMASAVIVKLPFDYAVNDQTLAKKIFSWERVKKFHLPQKLVRKIGEIAHNSNLSLTFETFGKPQKGFDVRNDKRSVSIPFRHVRENDVYDLMNMLDREEERIKSEERRAYIGSWVDNINSHVQLFRLNVEDKNSHAGISAEVKIYSYAPSIHSLLKEHLSTEEIMGTYSLITDYPENNEVFSGVSRGGSLAVYLYVPSKYKIEIVHPGYNFVDGKIDLNENKLERIVRMVEKGTKVRLGLFEGGGGIE